MRKLYLLAQDGRFDPMERVVTSILSCVPEDDPDAVQHAWSQLVWLAQEYDRAGVYDVAKFVLDASLRLAPHAAVAERAKRLAGIAAAQRDARRAQKDPRVARWILALVRARIGRGMPEAEFHALCERLVGEMRMDVHARAREWTTFRGWYPLVAAEIAEDWNALHEAATGRAAAPSSRRTRRAASGARRAGPKVSTSAGVVGVFGFVLAGLVVRGLISSARTPDPPRIDHSRTVEQMQRSIPSLEELLREIVEKEEARLGRKLTKPELEALLERWTKRTTENLPWSKEKK